MHDVWFHSFSRVSTPNFRIKTPNRSKRSSQSKGKRASCFLFEARAGLHSMGSSTMARGTTSNGKRGNGNGSTLGFEATLWATADKLRGDGEMT